MPLSNKGYEMPAHFPGLRPENVAGARIPSDLVVAQVEACPLQGTREVAARRAALQPTSSIFTGLRRSHCRLLTACCLLLSVRADQAPAHRHLRPGWCSNFF